MWSFQFVRQKEVNPQIINLKFEIDCLAISQELPKWVILLKW